MPSQPRPQVGYDWVQRRAPAHYPAVKYPEGWKGADEGGKEIPYPTKSRGAARVGESRVPMHRGCTGESYYGVLHN